MSGYEPSEDEIDRTFKKLDREAEEGGYHLNPDGPFTKELIWGLLVNGKRYGYWSCPCRPADGEKVKDLDIICPCDYRDPDLNEFGACYCALYVNDDIKAGKQKAEPIPERRPREEVRERIRSDREMASKAAPASTGALKYPIWRCTVCGYLCAREEPPLICPICKVKKDRFERFL
jgi:ferredoxin-thioredoxin reductase catalytic subunit